MLPGMMSQIMRLPANTGSQEYLSGSGNFNVPVFNYQLRVRIYGPGGTGSSITGGGSPVAVTGGTDTTFGGLTAKIGGHGGISTGSPGGVASGGDVNIDGDDGNDNINFGGDCGGGDSGGISYEGGAGGTPPSGANQPGSAGSDYGGGGSSGRQTGTGTGSGAGGGAFVEKVYYPGDISGSIAYAVGTTVAPFSTTYTGGRGGEGKIQIDWDYEW